jgi:hypothetical protein
MLAAMWTVGLRAHELCAAAGVSEAGRAERKEPLRLGALAAIWRAALRQFGRNVALRFDDEALAAPAKRHDPRLFRLLEAHAERVLAETPVAASFRAQVRREVVQRLRAVEPAIGPSPRRWPPASGRCSAGSAAGYARAVTSQAWAGTTTPVGPA